MNLFEGILMNTIILLSPLTMYTLYIVYAKKLDKEEKLLWLQLALLTSFYGLYKFGNNIFSFMPLFFVIFSLILAYTKKCFICIVILSALLIYYHYNYGFNIILLLLEYIIYFIINLKVKKHILFASLVLLVKLFFTILWLYYSNTYQNIDLIILFQMLIIVAIYYAILQVIIWLFYKSENIVNYHNIIEELEYEKQLKSSLFKITHEIKNPIAVCKGYLDMLDINNENQVNRYIPIIKEEIERTLVIIKDYLNIGHVVIEKDIIDVVLLLEEIMNSYEHILKKNNIVPNVRIDYDKIYIEADYNRLKQVLINIIKNSIEAIGTIGTLEISVEDHEKELVIVITDNGCGMSKKELEQIKKPFFTTKKNGIGLGISLSNEIIKAHNGTLEYSSELGKGTTVSIKIAK